ncbi:phage portal protein [Rhizobium leucaenae]|uniref:phage portal protein n=1 Tax=Rhizobium leucaenae TaxID=29450 RepID=UPI0007EE7517|nr:phage portal protein [Rhizobium leucaenae]
MGIWNKMFGREAAEQKSVSFDPVWESFFGYRQPKSGVLVNWQRALDVSTVFACLRVIANGVAQVPLQVMKELPDGKGGTPALDHPLYKVLNLRPNKWMTAFELREAMIFHVGLTGNFFAYKNIVRGQVRELIPIDPGCVSIIRNNDYSLTYTITSLDGTSRQLPQSLVWHVKGPSWDTWRGLDAVQQAREAIGLAIATESTQAEMHANGMQTSGVYSTDNKISPDEYKQIQAWIAAQTGGANRHKPFVIDSGFKWTPQSMTGVDAQHLETRKYQVEQICQAFGVFPQMIGHAGQAMTFASAEQVFLAHVVHTLGPWWRRIEESIDVNLLDGKEDEGFCAKFNANALLKGAAKDRSEFYSKALGSGGSPAWMTPNEIRALEDLNPIAGGDELPKPTNVGGAAAPNKPQDGQQDPKT